MAGRSDALVEIDHVSKFFDRQRGFVDAVLGRDPNPVRAVDEVSLSIERGEVLGIAGESGCGKTTLGKLLVKLHEVTEGEIRFDGQPVAALTREDEKAFRQRVQMIFQDPFESLNPRMTVLDTVAEPLRINKMGDSYHDRRERVVTVLEDVGLAPAETFLEQFPHELSGGERQRVAIARALVVDPEFVVADEPVSMLDVSIRASVLNLMKRLRRAYDLTYVFISHDLSLIRYMCDRTAIMYLGDVIEVGETEDVVTDPQHPYTQALFDAVPIADPKRNRKRANVTGEVPSARAPPDGCKFHPRCPAVIPPDDWSGTQPAYRRFLQFKHRVLSGTLGPEDFDPTNETEPIQQLLAHGLTLDVPEEHRAPSDDGTQGVDITTLDLPAETRDRLEAAARDVLAENHESAIGRVDGVYPSICEVEHPTMRSAGEQRAACHLYEETHEVRASRTEPSG